MHGSEHIYNLWHGASKCVAWGLCVFHSLVFSRGNIGNLLLWECCGHWNFFTCSLTRDTHV